MGGSPFHLASGSCKISPLKLLSSSKSSGKGLSISRSSQKEEFSNKASISGSSGGMSRGMVSSIIETGSMNPSAPGLFVAKSSDTTSAILSGKISGVIVLGMEAAAPADGDWTSDKAIEATGTCGRCSEAGGTSCRVTPDVWLVELMASMGLGDASPLKRNPSESSLRVEAASILINCMNIALAASFIRG
ncbi:hypothetical protein MLD38_038975 [Melastoma candidum]|uniref:Uncharacterized protein n=1 Tax=Melastoma candidum TaxID=119954 RepID=A0ACB9L1X5_9MYRT|nr:hypothetical protein MLD38_038975 [Melastoma candidum]